MALGPLLRRFVALFLAASFLWVPGSPVEAVQSQAADVDLDLVSIPAWHRPSGALDITVRVANRGSREITSFRLVVGVEDRVTSRSALHEGFDQPSSFQPSSFPKDVAGSLKPGRPRTIHITESVSELSLLENTTHSGVYPLTISLQDRSTAEVLGRLTLPLVVYPDTPEQRLNLALVVPLNEVATQDQRGVFVADESGRPPLESAVKPDGWLAGMLASLRAARRAGLEAAVAPTPRLVEELAATADGYQRGELERGAHASHAPQRAGQVLRALRELIGSEGIQRILVPYSFADLPALQHHYGSLGGDQITRQIAVGQEVLKDALGEEFTRSWLLAPSGRLDVGTIESLSLAGVHHVLGAENSFEAAGNPADAGCPDLSASFTCAVQVPTATHDMTGYIADAGLQERLARLLEPGDDRLDLQQFFAETAMIREEAPGLSGRVVEASVPSLWRPSARLARLFFHTLATAPWVETVTPQRGLDMAAQTSTRRAVRQAHPVAGEPPPSYWSSVRAAQELNDQFASIRPPAGLVQRLQRAVLVAQSRTWWMRSNPPALSGAEFVAGATEVIERDLDKIKIIGQDEIVLSSREAPVQLVISNDTGYPVRLAIKLFSDKLTFSDRRIEETLAPGTRTVVVDAASQTSGSFPLEARLLTPNGREVASKRLTIRSTELNVFAVGITVGALIFLIVFYSVRALRPRREREAAGALQS